MKATGLGSKGSAFSFTKENEAEAKKVLARYPEGRQASAVLPLLAIAQKQADGWLPTDVMNYVADYLDMPYIRVYEVASFYDMYNTEAVGRIQVRACTTTPCWLCGSDDVVKACKDELGIGIGESTEDGKFYLREFECLGACANAPILWVDDDFYEDLDYESTKAILKDLKAGKKPKPGSARARQGSMPIEGRTTLTSMAKEGGE